MLTYICTYIHIHKTHTYKHIYIHTLRICISPKENFVTRLCEKKRVFPLLETAKNKVLSRYGILKPGYEPLDLTLFSNPLIDAFIHIIHTHIHTYMHTYKHQTYTHAYIHTYMCTYIQTSIYILTCIYIYICITYIQIIHIHTNIHTYYYILL